MALPPIMLVKETGAGLVDANSYADVADGDAYHAGHLYASAWAGELSGRKTMALLMATRLLDTEFAFNGVRTLPAQALQWPRMDCPEPDGTTAQFVAPGGAGVVPKFIIPGGAGKLIVVDNPMLVPGNVVPKSVVEATCELARELLVKDRTAAPLGEGIKYESKSATDTTPAEQVGYEPADRPPVIPRVVQAMLAKYGSLFNAKSGTVRLVRV
jgi:hypothetical protein